jgi:hypothetical protein
MNRHKDDEQDFLNVQEFLTTAKSSHGHYGFVDFHFDCPGTAIKICPEEPELQDPQDSNQLKLHQDFFPSSNPTFKKIISKFRFEVLPLQAIEESQFEEEKPQILRHSFKSEQVSPRLLLLNSPKRKTVNFPEPFQSKPSKSKKILKKTQSPYAQSPLTPSLPILNNPLKNRRSLRSFTSIKRKITWECFEKSNS